MDRLKALGMALAAGIVFVFSPVLIPLAVGIGIVVVIYKLVRHDQTSSKDHQD